MNKTITYRIRELPANKWVLSLLLILMYLFLIRPLRGEILNRLMEHHNEEQISMTIIKESRAVQFIAPDKEQTTYSIIIPFGIYFMAAAVCILLAAKRRKMLWLLIIFHSVFLFVNTGLLYGLPDSENLIPAGDLITRYLIPFGSLSFAVLAMMDNFRFTDEGTLRKTAEST